MTLIDRIDAFRGRTFEEVPCWCFLEQILPSWPPKNPVPVDKDFLREGDLVGFGDPPADANSAVGIYLASGKVAASLPEHGVCLIPWRFVRERFLWGMRGNG